MHAYKDVIFIIRAKFFKYFKQDKFNCCNWKRVSILFTNYNKNHKYLSWCQQQSFWVIAFCRKERKEKLYHRATSQRGYTIYIPVVLVENWIFNSKHFKNRVPWRFEKPDECLHLKILREHEGIYNARPEN